MSTIEPNVKRPSVAASAGAYARRRSAMRYRLLAASEVKP
jgi:hypothetical protein